MLHTKFQESFNKDVHVLVRSICLVKFDNRNILVFLPECNYDLCIFFYICHKAKFSFMTSICYIG